MRRQTIDRRVEIMRSLVLRAQGSLSHVCGTPCYPCLALSGIAVYDRRRSVNRALAIFMLLPPEERIGYTLFRLAYRLELGQIARQLVVNPRTV